MSVFNTNQNRQFYVAKAINEAVSESSTAGDIQVRYAGMGSDKELYFLVKGAENVLKSDRMSLKNISYIKAIPAADMVKPLKSFLVSLDASVNSGKPVVGQDYLLRIAFRQFYGMSDEDQYFKDCAVRATADMNATPRKFYDAMVNALNLSFSREVGANKSSNPYLKFEASDEGILITEKEQEWNLGIERREQVMFQVIPTTVYVDGQDVIWGTVEDKTPKISEAVVGTTGLGNGKDIADLEWFCMGERGDQYRLMGYPNYIPTHYLVDPSLEYDALEIHYNFTDTGVNSYKSEKDITIVASSANNSEIMKALIAKINSVTGQTLVENPFE